MEFIIKKETEKSVQGLGGLQAHPAACLLQMRAPGPGPNPALRQMGTEPTSPCLSPGLPSASTAGGGFSEQQIES